MDKKWFEQLLKVLLIGLFLPTSVAKSEELFPAHVNNSKIQLKLYSQAEFKASKNMSNLNLYGTISVASIICTCFVHVYFDNPAIGR